MDEQKLVECPCCSNSSTVEKWNERAGDDYIPCPVCENVIERWEFNGALGSCQV